MDEVQAYFSKLDNFKDLNYDDVAQVKNYLELNKNELNEGVRGFLGFVLEVHDNINEIQNRAVIQQNRMLSLIGKRENDDAWWLMSVDKRRDKLITELNKLYYNILEMEYNSKKYM